jgi:hypothetical protein
MDDLLNDQSKLYELFDTGSVQHEGFLFTLTAWDGDGAIISLDEVDELIKRKHSE